MHLGFLVLKYFPMLVLTVEETRLVVEINQTVWSGVKWNLLRMKFYGMLICKLLL